MSELVTDVIAKEQKTNEIQYKINYTNKGEDKFVYQFRFEDIPLNYCNNMTFDFDSFYGTEGFSSTDGEMGFFFNLTKNDIDKDLNDWGPDTPEEKKTCNFYLLTINKYKDYEIADDEKKEIPVIYEIKISKYNNINYNNLINKNIIGDKDGYDINTVYCDVSCIYTLVDSVKIEADRFVNIKINSNTKALCLNSNIFENLADEEINNVCGIYSKVNKDKTFKGTWHFSAKEKQ